MGQCRRCDARGCFNADNPEGGIETCSAFSSKPGATEDEKQYIENQRSFLKATGNKYRSPPYLKGVPSRSALNQDMSEPRVP